VRSSLFDPEDGGIYSYSTEMLGSFQSSQLYNPGDRRRDTHSRDKLRSKAFILIVCSECIIFERPCFFQLAPFFRRSSSNYKVACQTWTDLCGIWWIWPFWLRCRDCVHCLQAYVYASGMRDEHSLSQDFQPFKKVRHGCKQDLQISGRFQWT
jgi:hypothetical protein